MRPRFLKGSVRSKRCGACAAAGAKKYSAVAGGDFISLLKDTSLAFIVNVPELTTVAGQINNRVQIYPAAIFIFTGVIYYLLCCSLELLAKGWRVSRPAL